MNNTLKSTSVVRTETWNVIPAECVKHFHIEIILSVLKDKYFLEGSTMAVNNYIWIEDTFYIDCERHTRHITEVELL